MFLIWRFLGWDLEALVTGICMMDGLTISHVGCLKFRQVWLGDGPYRLWVVGDFWVFFPLMMVG